MTSPLPDDVQWTLQQADGYMDLGMWTAARALLEGIPKEWDSHPQRQTLLLREAVHEENWAASASLADTLQQADPSSVQHRISLAYALRRSEGIPAARAVLDKSLLEFPEDPIVSYNLACYDCVEGHLEGAVKRLTRILKTHPDILRLIENDEDLETVRDFFDGDAD